MSEVNGTTARPAATAVPLWRWRHATQDWQRVTELAPSACVEAAAAAAAAAATPPERHYLFWGRAHPRRRAAGAAPESWDYVDAANEAHMSYEPLFARPQDARDFPAHPRFLCARLARAPALAPPEPWTNAARRLADHLGAAVEAPGAAPRVLAVAFSDLLRWVDGDTALACSYYGWSEESEREREPEPEPEPESERASDATRALWLLEPWRAAEAPSLGALAAEPARAGWPAASTQVLWADPRRGAEFLLDTRRQDVWRAGHWARLHAWLSLAADAGTPWALFLTPEGAAEEVWLCWREEWWRWRRHALADGAAPAGARLVGLERGARAEAVFCWWGLHRAPCLLPWAAQAPPPRAGWCVRCDAATARAFPADARARFPRARAWSWGAPGRAPRTWDEQCWAFTLAHAGAAERAAWTARGAPRAEELLALWARWWELAEQAPPEARVVRWTRDRWTVERALAERSAARLAADPRAADYLGAPERWLWHEYRAGARALTAAWPLRWGWVAVPSAHVARDA